MVELLKKAFAAFDSWVVNHPLIMIVAGAVGLVILIGFLR